MDPTSDTEDFGSDTEERVKVDKKALERLVAKLKKTLERPDQVPKTVLLYTLDDVLNVSGTEKAELELDPDGFLNLSALGGKFRIEKMSVILGLASTASATEVHRRFEKLVCKDHPKIFDWKHPSDKEAEAGEVASVRLHGHASKRAAVSEAKFMFPGAVPHSLRVLVDKGDVKRRDLFEPYFKPGVPILFIEPKSIVEYRGVANDAVVDFLENALATGQYQLAILTFVGDDARLDKMQSRSSYLLEQLGLGKIPSFACSGNRFGLIGFAELCAEALDTTATVLNRGQGMLEAIFGDSGAAIMSELNFPEPFNTTLWMYASKSTRSTSSTVSMTGPLETEGDPADAAAIFACNLWQSFHDEVDNKASARMLKDSRVLVDTEANVQCVGATKVPLLSLESMMHPVTEFPKSAFGDVSAVVMTNGSLDVDSVREYAQNAEFTGTAASFLMYGILLSDSSEFDKVLEHYQDVFLELVDDDLTEQTKLLLAVGGAAIRESRVMQQLLKLLKKLYDLDIAADEDAYFAWESKQKQGHIERGSEVISKATPFLQWLREAESDNDDS